MTQYDCDFHKTSTLEEYNSTRPSEFSSIWGKVNSSGSLKKLMTKSETKEEDFNGVIERKESEYQTDSRLANWRRWLDIHKEQQDKLSNILQRPPQCLLMNMNFHKLHVNQEKRLISEATDYQFCDKYRGHPSFWMPYGGAHSTTNKMAIYQTIQKRYNRSRPAAPENWYPEPSELEYVGVPDVIMEEKGLLGEQCLPHPRDKWDTSHYVAEKKENLKLKLDLFQEHTPEPDDLVIVGFKCTRTDGSRVVNFELENSQEESCEVDIEESSSTLEKIEPTIRETVTVSVEDEILDNNSKVWTVYFGNCITHEFYERSLTIQNLNDCCLRYSWEAVLPAFVNNPLPLKKIRNNKYYYFNKNDGVVLPMSCEKFTMNFESDKGGVFCEKWILHLSNAPDKEEGVIVELQAVVEERPETEENLQVIESYIESCTRYAIASKTVKELLERSRRERPISLPYDWMFFEEQIFLYNNPDLFYESKNVTLLKDIYKRISEGPWDFSVQTLRKKMLEKTLQEDITETVNEFTAAVCKLMKPKLINSINNEKHKSVYELLCCFFDRMEMESDNLKCILKIPLKIVASLDIGLVKPKKSRTSKVNSKDSVTSKRSSKRKSKRKIRFSDEKTSTSGSEDLSMLRQSLSSGESSGTMRSEIEEKIKKQEYLQALYIKTYHHLCSTVDNIAAVIDSFDIQKEKSALLSLKTNLQHSSVSQIHSYM